MTKTFILSRLGGTALSTVFALVATPALAQEVSPPETATPPAAEIAPDPLAVQPATSDPLAAEPVAEPPTTEAADTTALPAKEAAPARSKTAAIAPKKPSTKFVAPVAAATATEVAPPAPSEGEAAQLAPPLAVAPVPDPVIETPVAAATSAGGDELPLALGAGLGLLALGGAGLAFGRRRRVTHSEESTGHEPTISRGAVGAPQRAVDANERSAFNWGSPASTDRSWVERAHRGPTPENPFLSLKKRLQRAAFYDQRERAVAAGRATPLSPMAGLPTRFANAVKARSRAPAYGFTYVPA